MALYFAYILLGHVASVGGYVHCPRHSCGGLLRGHSPRYTRVDVFQAMHFSLAHPCRRTRASFNSKGAPMAFHRPSQRDTRISTDCHSGPRMAGLCPAYNISTPARTLCILHCICSRSCSYLLSGPSGVRGMSSAGVVHILYPVLPRTACACTRGTSVSALCDLIWVSRICLLCDI
ncbi:hypothetical protein FIBSPDRAFT_234563 [Athelia psychrophila]|uniref:Secreted protein n=1 Tax=Athelia psychrophila TaxID=1759441 RepID=A0A166RY73_9AGAM|nr:hypothetical protein FIBSPDRAFT_234563 [Fibularhizoctonia sp. CBS 109695]